MILARTSKIRVVLILLFLSITLVVIWFRKENNDGTEGFSQEAEFVLKEGDDIFDEFYAQIYSIINEPGIYVDSVSNSVIKYTSIKPDESSLLLLASDTGEQSNSIKSKGYDVNTLFKYKSMFEQSRISYPLLDSKLARFDNPMAYDKGTFSHALCLGNIIYTIRDKIVFFRNIYNWLIPNGVFLLQLSDRSKFNTIKTGSNLGLIDSPQKYHDERITDSEIDFGSFKYLSRYDFRDAESDNLVYLSETFTDKYTKQVRKNEHTLYMENIDEILNQAFICGFSVSSKINLVEDEHQFIYVLDRKH
jgi:SAM-dependent methyltransferase